MLADRLTLAPLSITLGSSLQLFLRRIVTLSRTQNLTYAHSSHIPLLFPALPSVHGSLLLHVHARSLDVRESFQYPCTLSRETTGLQNLSRQQYPIQPRKRGPEVGILPNIPKVGCTSVLSSKMSNLCSCAQASIRSQFLHSCSISKSGFGARSFGTQSKVRRETSALHTGVRQG